MKWLVTVIMCLFLAGCMEVVKDDGQVHTVIDPCSVARVEGVVEGLGNTGVGLGPLAPWAGMAGTALLGMLAAWRKLKPELVAAKNRDELTMAAGSVTAKALELVKNKYPDVWKEVGPYINNQVTKDIDNVLRGFRGLE